ncbi:hypothetical protein MKZ38_004036 [Zalerion maritima]|uniref:Pectinesterase n=1 Tax=Zalerion maritima TaxID=339359 RepID=A0AAD5WRC3_9PEZI|nr:hypothetical protein MKZ38_004036 [Zalerion maritima]
MLTKSLVSLSYLVASALGASRTSAPSGAYVVAKSGGAYSSIQDAVNAVPTSTSGDYIIFVNPGTYSEQVLVSSMTGTLTIYGYTTDDQDYSKNEVVLTNNLGADDAGSNDASGTLRAKADYLSVYNINVVNERGQGDQAIALSAYGEYQGFYGCQFVGYQDTVLSNDGHHAFKNCYVEGATDFVFGLRAIAWFQSCDIGIVGQGYITANGRDSEDNDSYYVFDDCAVINKASVGTGGTYLGRPWREYSRVVFQNSDLGAVVNSAGWRIWNEGDERTDHVYYGEYGNYGTGASGTRASFATAMASPLTLSGILGSTDWIDSDYWDNTGSSGSTTSATSATTMTTVTTVTTATATTSEPTEPSVDCASRWGQCGGQGWTGPICCSDGACTFSNTWYSQCI